MPWSNWYPFNTLSIKLNAPNLPGIYRIKLQDGSCFALESQGGSYYWKGVYPAEEDLVSCFRRNEPLRVCNCTSGICTDLIYIGESGNIRQRLLQHLNGNSSKCIKALLNRGFGLFFSFLQRQDPDDSEVRAFGRFVSKTGRFCLPCDCGSNECSNAEGVAIDTYINGRLIC